MHVMRSQVEKVAIGYPFEELTEEFNTITTKDENLDRLSTLVEKVVWSIKHAPGGHERQRLQELLDDIAHFLKYNVRFYPELENVLEFGSTFRGQSGKFATVYFGDNIPKLFTRFMITPQMRECGMQAYRNLSNFDSLFFDHSSCQDVTYHMGTTKFPIDIFFLELDSEGIYTISKIVSKVMPGSTSLFSQRRVSAVLETVGGFAASNEIEPGDSVKLVDESLFSSFPNDKIFICNVHDVIRKVSKLDLESETRLQKIGDTSSVFVVELPEFPTNEFKKRQILETCGIPRDLVIWSYLNV